MRRWSAMIGVLAMTGCSSVAQRPVIISGRPTDIEMRKDFPELQKYFRTSLNRVYSASKVALRDMGWQIVADRLLGKEAKIEAQQGEARRTTIFFGQVTPVRTRVAVLVSGTFEWQARGIASDVHQRIARILRVKAED